MSSIIEKPWGYEELWAKTKNYVGKILFIREGCRLSLQHHQKKEESMRLLSGKVILFLENESGEMEKRSMVPGDCADIFPGRKHRLLALQDSQMLEVSTTELDDIVRHEDDFGRA